MRRLDDPSLPMVGLVGLESTEGPQPREKVVMGTCSETTSCSSGPSKSTHHLFPTRPGVAGRTSVPRFASCKAGVWPTSTCLASGSTAWTAVKTRNKDQPFSGGAVPRDPGLGSPPPFAPLTRPSQSREFLLLITPCLLSSEEILCYIQSLTLFLLWLLWRF